MEGDESAVRTSFGAIVITLRRESPLFQTLHGLVGFVPGLLGGSFTSLLGKREEEPRSSRVLCENQAPGLAR